MAALGEGKNGVVYLEVQHMEMKGTWIMMGVIWTLMATFFGLLLWGMEKSKGDVYIGDVTGSVVCAGLVAFLITLLSPLMALRMRMEVAIDSERIRIYLWPWYRREFEVSKVRSVVTRECRPFREFGSRGARRVRGWGFAYLIKGDWGVDVTMSDGRHLFIGSQKPDELKNALDRIKPAVA